MWWRKKSEPLDLNEYSVRCIAHDCGRSWWSYDNAHVVRLAEQSGWVRTPYGWLCNYHVREARAFAYVVAHNETEADA